MAIKLKLFPFVLARQLIVTTLQASAVSTLPIVPVWHCHRLLCECNLWSYNLQNYILIYIYIYIYVILSGNIF